MPGEMLDRELLENEGILLFHWGILFEIMDGYARVSRRANGLQLLAKFESGQGYHLRPITDPLLQGVLNPYRTRPDKDWGLTDCVSFALITPASNKIKAVQRGQRIVSKDVGNN